LKNFYLRIVTIFENIGHNFFFFFFFFLN
jgi:hypothetical protein